MIKGSYDWLEHTDGDHTDGFDQYYSKYNCKYKTNAGNKLVVSCAIEQGPTVITNARSPTHGNQSVIDPKFYGVKGFSFVSEKASPFMKRKERERKIKSEISRIFDFIRNPLV